MRGGGSGAATLRAVLLDLDGTLVDTTAAWRRAYGEVAAAHGRSLPTGWWAMAAGHGMADSTVVLGVDPATEPDRAGSLAAELTARGAAALDAPGSWQWRPGAEALLADLHASGTAHAVVTAVEARVAGPLLARMGARPDAVVTGDDVARGKPAPDPYLRAAELLGAAPEACLVVEDSPTGVAAATAAGMPVLVVPQAGTVPPAPGCAIRATLDGVGVRELAGLHARLRSDASPASRGGTT